MIHTVRFKVLGRVQGVGFRYSTLRQARSLGVDGWVRNEADGSVTVHLQGDEAVVKAMSEWLERGPSYARVEGLREMPAPYDPGCRDFDIRY